MTWRVEQGDWISVLRTMPDESVHCVVTSPPYWGLRDYGVTGQLGLERTPEEYVAKMVEGFREVRRVLRSDGTLWLNLGDSYSGSMKGIGADGTAYAGAKQATNKGSVGITRQRTDWDAVGLKPKDLCGIPWLVAFALRADGWYLRQDIIWAKPNPMPESVTDRCTKSHEYIFLLTKSARYFYDNEAVKEPWTCDRDDMREKGVRTGTAYLQQGPNGYSNSVKPHLPGNKSHKGKTAYENGQTEHRTKAGLVDYAESLRSGEAQFTGRNKRSVWTITTSPFPEAHFATFPPKLVEPCILAGTSERGCCAECGAPWERIVEKSGGTIGQSWHNHEDHLGRGQRGGDGKNLAAELYSTYECKTVGWKPGCKCYGDNGCFGKAHTVPCTVLDPFNGAGTTGLVSTRLGRHYIGIELNPQYVEMAERRIVNDAPLFNTLEVNA